MTATEEKRGSMTTDAYHAFPLLEKRLGAQLDVDVSTVAPGAVTVVASKRRL